MLTGGAASGQSGYSSRFDGAFMREPQRHMWMYPTNLVTSWGEKYRCIWAHLGAFSETESRSDLSGNVVTAPIQSRNELTQFGATIAENRARFHFPPLRFSFTLSRYVCVCVCAGVWVCKCVGWANNQHNFTGNSTLIRNSGSVHLLFSYATNLIKMN